MTLHFTRRAIEWTRLCQERMNRTGSGLRIAIVGGGQCAGYRYFVGFDDEPSESDRRIEMEGFTLYIDPETWNEIEGGTVDFADGPEGSGFVVSLSEERLAKHRCCCGKTKG